MQGSGFLVRLFNKDWVDRSKAKDKKKRVYDIDYETHVVLVSPESKTDSKLSTTVIVTITNIGYSYHKRSHDKR